MGRETSKRMHIHADCLAVQKPKKWEGKPATLMQIHADCLVIQKPKKWDGKPATHMHASKLNILVTAINWQPV